MPTPIKFYQTGTFTVGNRLLDAALLSVQAAPERTNSLNSGHRACQGCGEALGARYVVDAAVRATGGQLAVVNATGCLEVFSTPYPESSWRVAWLHSLFGNAPAVATGVAAAMRRKGRAEVRVLAQGGDGGTTDIGMGCLSGMFERNDDVLYVCYDIEAYMNTGVQRSSATPPGARTATTPAFGRPSRRRLRNREERAVDRDGASHSLRRDGVGGRSPRSGGKGREGDGDARRALLARSRAVSARLGIRSGRHDQGGAAGR